MPTTTLAFEKPITLPASEQPTQDEAPKPAAKQPRYLVPVLSLKQEAVLRLLVVGWVMTTALFWLWWLAPARGEWTVGRGVATAGLAWLFLLGAYFLFFACRINKPNPALPLPELRVAIVVTKAPSEPWAMVEQTLRAMLAQDMPYKYDVWLADERPSGKALRWCRGHGVQVSTRQGVAEYHQPTWPRRTKSKEGNLAYFYDKYGYERYDVVAQLDADHVPAPGYLKEMVRPFADPAIGYVAAPSVCDANEDKGWTVKGRLHREASLHGPVQAGSNGGWAPLCIGSHYAVRTAALREVGGLGPELAEDYATTLWLQSAGWGGAFAIDAEAHGDGPETFDDMILQELQWSRSLGTVLTKWAPQKFGTVPWKARARMSFALLFYLVQGIVCLAAVTLPMLGVLTGVAWGNTTFLQFYVHMWLPSLFLMRILGLAPAVRTHAAGQREALVARPRAVPAGPLAVDDVGLLPGHVGRSAGDAQAVQGHPQGPEERPSAEPQDAVAAAAAVRDPHGRHRDRPAAALRARSGDRAGPAGRDLPGGQRRGHRPARRRERAAPQPSSRPLQPGSADDLAERRGSGGGHGGDGRARRRRPRVEGRAVLLGRQLWPVALVQAATLG